ncbi:MAG: hypothetical protein H0U22_12470 [Geodermatophilaceae bacterium]|nr:hypothetical protein [Geodermatophilaceae bacterium]
MNDALPIAKADLANQMQLLKTAMDEFPSQVSAWLPRGRSVVPDRGDRGSSEFGQLAWRSVDREIRALAVLEIAGVGRRVASCPENHVLDVRHQLANAQGQALLEIGWAAPAGVRQR